MKKWNIRRTIMTLAWALTVLPTSAQQKGDWLRNPYGAISNDGVTLNALDIRDQHQDDIKQLQTLHKLNKVEVVTAADDFWYYSLQSADGLYGVADQQGNILLPPIYSTLNYSPGMNAFTSAMLFRSGKQNISIPLNVPSSQPCFIVSQGQEYKVLDMRGNVLREGMTKPIFYNYYLLTGVQTEDIYMQSTSDTTACLMVGGPKVVPLHIYTLNGREVPLPSDPIINGDARYYAFDTPFMDAPSQKDINKDNAAPTGTLVVNSDHPSARVKVDGVTVGRVPLTLSLRGEHNITVVDRKNDYYSGVEHLNVEPGTNVERYFTLKPMPQKTEYFIGLQYGTASGSLGGMIGLCKNWGGYAKVLLRGGQKTNSAPALPLQTTNPFHSIPIGKLEYPFACSYTAGAMYRVCPYVLPYLGLGYAKYSSGRNVDFNIAPAHIAGLVLDVGAILAYKWVFASVGWTPMVAVTEKRAAKSYGDLHIGLGVKFRIYRKRGN